MNLHLRYCLQDADSAGEHRHPSTVLREMGITYQLATPQSVIDQWLFWNCVNIPSKLLPYIAEFDANPMDYVGKGLTEVEALRIESGG